MKKQRNIYITVFILLIITAAGVLITNSTSSLHSKETEFAISDTSSVTKIFIADKHDRTVVLTKMPGHWNLNGKYNAHEENVRMLLKTMNSIRVMEPVSNAARNTVIKLLAAGGTKVEIYQMVPRIKVGSMELFPHEKLTRTYYVGAHTQDNLGTYMLMEGSENPYIVYIPGFRGFVSSRYHAREIDWREHIIFKKRLPQIASLQVEIPSEPEESYIINNINDRDFSVKSLFTGEEVSSVNREKVLDIMTSFEEVNFEAFITHFSQHEKDSILSQNPWIILTLKDKKGNTTRLKTFRRPALNGQTEFIGEEIPYDVDRLYAVKNDEQELLLIQYFVFDKITRKLSYLKY